MSGGLLVRSVVLRRLRVDQDESPGAIRVLWLHEPARIDPAELGASLADASPRLRDAGFEHKAGNLAGAAAAFISFDAPDELAVDQAFEAALLARPGAVPMKFVDSAGFNLGAAVAARAEATLIAKSSAVPAKASRPSPSI